MQKRCFSMELAYALGLVLLALGTALMERANFGVSMVVAPAYLIYLKLSPALPFFTFGMAEYALQAALLMLLWLVMGRFRPAWLLSFATAVIYGLILDLCMALASRLPDAGLAGRLADYLVGMALCAAGVSLLFHTYIAPEVYELFVKEVAGKLGMPDHRFKTIYDCASCAVAVGMSFLFFGLWRFEGVKAGTVVCALVNGWLIGRFSAFFEAHWRFEAKLSRRLAS